MSADVTTARYYVHYQDDGPSGAGGQALSYTAPWDRLYMFSRPKPMLDFIHDVGVETFRLNARVLGSWAQGDEHYATVTDWTVAPWNG